MVRMDGKAQGLSQNPARQGVEATRPHQGGQHLHAVRPVSNFDYALDSLPAYLIADSQTAPVILLPGRGRRRAPMGNDTPFQTTAGKDGERRTRATHKPKSDREC